MKRFVVCCLLLVVRCSLVYSQNYDDAGLWATLDIQKNLKNNFAVFLTQELRLKENFSRINLLYTDVGVSLRATGFLKLAVAYRSIEKQQLDDSYSFRHRLMLDIILRKKFANTTISYRQRLQAEVRDVQSSEKGGIPEWYSRNKLEFKHDISKKYTPIAVVEFRYQITSPYSVEANDSWQSYRVAFGFEYELNKKNMILPYYLIQREVNISQPGNIYIVGIAYYLTL